jgi:hypothetical protein
VIPNPKCTCCVNCLIYEDAFASDSLAASWSETVGMWAISGGVLSTSDADSILIANTVHPDGDDSPAFVSARIRMAAALDIARLIIAWDDSSNYLFAEFWIEDGCVHIQAYTRIAGTNTAVGDEFIAPFAASTSTYYPASLCYTPGEDAKLTIRINEPSGLVWSEEVAVSGTFGDRAGVGTGNPVDNTIRFDDFSYKKLYDASTRPSCPACSDRSDYEFCGLFSDEFFRDDSTNIGCAWEEVAEDWSISSNKLVVTAADALTIWRGKHPDATTDVRIRFSFSVDTGGIVYLILDYADDLNFVFVKIEPGSHGLGGQVSFWRKSAGTDTQLGMTSRMSRMPSGLSNVHAFSLCWQDDQIVLEKSALSGSGDDASYHGVLGVTQMAADPRVGLGTGSSSEVQFSEFWVYKYGTGDLGCVDCAAVPCQIYNNDPRNTSANTTEPGLWDVVSGTWGYNTTTTAQSRWVQGNGDWITASSDAMVICKVGHPGMTLDGLTDLTCKLSLGISTFDFGNVARAIIGWQDSSNYLFAEVEFAATAWPPYDYGFLRVGKVVAGTPTVLGEIQLSLSGSQPNLDVGLSSGQGNSVLQVCYDGMLIRASFLSMTLAGLAVNELATVSGTAGTGWIPGYFGVATGTMTAGDMVFGNFIYSHDLDFCGDCTAAASRCHICYTLDGSEIVDKTPNAILVKIEGLASTGGTPDCTLTTDYNDTFVLPFYGVNDSVNNDCVWHTVPLICVHPTDSNTKDALTLSMGRYTSGSDVGWRLTVQLTAWSDVYSGSPGQGTVTWTEIVLIGEVSSYFDGIGGQSMDCIDFLDDWIVIDDSVGTGFAFFLDPGASTVSIKIA